MSEQSISDRLRMGTSMSPGQPVLVRPVSQVTLQLVNNNLPQCFQKAQSIVLEWMVGQAGRELSESAMNGESFELDAIGAPRISAIKIDAPNYWAARVDRADKTIPERTWTTEISLATDSDKHIVLGCRLFCTTRGTDVPFSPSLPRFIREVIGSEGAVLDGRSLDQSPWFIQSEIDVDDLVNLICNPQRTRDVFVFSLPQNSEDINDTIIPVDGLARTTLGAAHIAVITGPAAFQLTSKVGKEFSVYNQAVRTYRTGFDLDESGQFDHPIALPQSINNWTSGGARNFDIFLRSQALGIKVTREELEKEFPPFREVKRIAAELTSKNAKSLNATDAEMLQLTYDENDRLDKFIREQKEEYDGLLALAEEDRTTAELRAEDAVRQTANMRARVEFLQASLRAQGAESETITIPDSLSDLDSWAQKYLSGSIIIHNRAFRTAKNSPFDDVEFVYKTLLMLRDHYVPMRRSGGGDLKATFDAECQKLNLEEQQTFGNARSGEQGDEYVLMHAGKKRELDRHLKGSNSRDPRYGFRLYFFWDEETRQVVVGSLPGHLQTRAS